MLKIIASLISLFAATTAIAAEEISLTIEDFDLERQRASILVVDASQVPLGVILRVHSKTGTCSMKITERVNDHLIGQTQDCSAGSIRPGMKLAYTPINTWEQPEVARTPTQESEVSTSYDMPDLVDEFFERTTFFLGINFASELEGNVIADGSIRNLDGDSAISMGLRVKAYQFTPRLWVSGELGYETPRTFDRGTFVNNGTTNTQGTPFSPRLSVWSLTALGNAQLMERLVGFAGISYSLPSLSNSPFDMSGDVGFQGGATYQVLPNIGVEGLIKITNMNLKNNIGETTDVSLAGLELRGRYNF